MLEDLIQNCMRVFTKETGIQVHLVEGSADERIERIRSEGEDTKADVFVTVDVGRLWRAQKTYRIV